ncbi:MAG: hypothetical protein R3207_10610 [Oceanospirillum sp.]|nr:hypothetical protein [Oceanospirillum sp.]
MTPDLIFHLGSFNAKERFHLLSYTSGGAAFQLGDQFKSDVERVLNLPIPQDAFVAMDYHLDWIFAALHLSSAHDTSAIFPNCGEIKAQQEDIDFLIAFLSEGRFHLVMIEAKSASAWSNSQLSSKAQRMREIFGDQGDRWPDVIPHFLLVSPEQSGKLKNDDWPQWMRVSCQWIELPVPDNLKKITRCDDSGMQRKEGKNWRVIDR